ncbi:GTPase Era, mitochondrial isoform X2 [Chanos chanos]|uniref:GTPase Era, mitochondrial n=1 Tax=Chanos chanos TaxID=29144 RepID=A0A6J2WVV1_CHACN|nr:GTPase Era, mitochondrial isoform X2 [Chanos chanos]
MALRICKSVLRQCLRYPVISTLSAPLENASLRAGLSGKTVFRFTPTCFITSEAFLDRLAKGKPAGTHDGPGHYPVSVPAHGAEQLSLLLKDPDQPANPKSLKVAVIGAPNAGKSTLTNQLLGRKLFAVSKKVHTTRSRALGVLTEDDTQIVLLDTPGLTTPSKVKRHHLESSLLLDPMDSLQEADMVVVLVDVSDKWTRSRLDFEVLKCLAHNPRVPAVLVLNKVDLLKNKTALLDITSALTEGMVNGQRLRVHSAVKPRPRQAPVRQPTPPPAPTQTQDTPPGGQARRALSGEELMELKKRHGWPHFKDVFMLSAVDGEDVETLKMYLVVAAKPGPWQYHSDVLTDQTPEDVCINTVREKLLEYLPQEVPYTMTLHIEQWTETEQGELDISVKLHVKKDSHMRMVIGQGGHMVAKMAREAGNDLSDVFMREVRLKISAKLKH